MQVLPRTVGDATILQVNGPLVLDTDYQAVAILRRSIDALGDRGRGSVILDLANVGAIDALGLGELIRAYKAVQARGGTLKLLRPNTRVERLLSVTRIDSVECFCRGYESGLGGWG